ncbi:TadE/TadG family type IV pilus assembly protein [Ammonifex thiophilus]|uniref:TadE-like domain-containing protein n=1 Tax=Ammonifex thiophilus TaxID=444093 RepID=A0A3D8P278_9THEO|nr:TadE/TadG family type IV pilus assembly protein [Ammonifex thiophilus]RDV82344.1 hypothetical protein DXX99_07995 [Ammonifex thiophilus]
MARWLAAFLKGEDGLSNAASFLLLFPLLLALAFGAAFFGHAAAAKNVAEEAARAGARWLAAHPGDVAGAKLRAADVVLNSFTEVKGVGGGQAPPGALVGRLEKRGGEYYVGGTRVRPASPGVRAQMESLVGRDVAAEGTYGEDPCFVARAATADPPGTRAAVPPGGSATGQPGTQGSQEVGGVDYGVSYGPAQVPEYMVAGETYTVQVGAKNTGSLAWTPQGRFGLSYHWYDRNTGKVVLWDGARDYVEAPVAAGQGYTFDLPVTAPPGPGVYTLVIDMVQEGVTWFEQKGCPVLRADVEVPRGEVLKGVLTYDGSDYRVGDTLVRSAGPDLSRFAGQRVTLWGDWAGKEGYFLATSVGGLDLRSAVTFDPQRDVVCNDPVAGDPGVPPTDPASRPRTDGYAWCRVTYRVPLPAPRLWGWLARRGVWGGPAGPSFQVAGEAFFSSGEEGEANVKR